MLKSICNIYCNLDAHHEYTKPNLDCESLLRQASSRCLVFTAQHWLSRRYPAFRDGK